jgi:hypothetical protein
MNSKNAGGTSQTTPRSDTALDSKYGEIGIPAVAAALQFKSEPKPSTNSSGRTPAASRQDHWYSDIAA